MCFRGVFIFFSGCVSDAEEGRGGQDDAGDYGYDADNYDGEEGDLDGQEYGFVMFDPVWGKPDYPPGHHTTKCQASLGLVDFCLKCSYILSA